MKTDEDFLANDKDAGTTSVCLLITKDGRLICGNTGDSRAVLAKAKEVVALSIDHKPMNEMEHKRIINAGSVVTFDRVDGELAVARAVGDARFKSNQSLPLKDQAVTAFPEVHVEPLDSECDFVILACDGVWDVYSSEACVQFVRDRLKEHRDMKLLAEQLVDSALQLGSKDNITALVIVFKRYLDSLPAAVPPPAPPVGPADEMNRLD